MAGKLPKREYYPLDLAAVELGCTVRDLFHLAVFEQLGIYTRFNRGSGHKLVARIARPDIKEKFKVGNEWVPESGNGIAAFPWDPDESGEYVAQSFEGFFCIPGMPFEDVELLDNYADATVTVHSLYFGHWLVDRPLTDFDEDVLLLARIDLEVIPKVEVPVAQLVIMADDLERLKPITRQDVSEVVSASVESVPKEKVHGNTEVNARNRVSVLSAAIYCKEHFPDQCKNYTAWARVIVDKALLFWPETGEPPMQERQIAALLSSANKTAKDAK